MKDIKVILFDVDGVLIKLPHFFSKELELKGYENAEGCLNAYYDGYKHLSNNEGAGDHKEQILPYLKEFGWEYSADEYLKQQFAFEHGYLDGDMIGIVDNLRLQGVKCCLATDQEKHRAQYLLESMNFGTVFDAHFISCFIGGRKCHDRFWEYVVNELKNSPVSFEPVEIAFFDDDQNNIETASKFGVKAFLFETMSKFRADMSLLGFSITHG